jgi:hypothetical protein
MPNLVADSCIHKSVCFQPGGGGCVSKCRHWLAVEKFSASNNGSTPCRFFRREKILVGHNEHGEPFFNPIPWCDHEPSQRAVP